MSTYIVTRKPQNPSIKTVSDALAQIPRGWNDLFTEHRDNLEEISKTIGIVTIPPPSLIFEAYHAVPLDRVRVVILGQDPYPGTKHGVPEAIGMAFSYRRANGVSASMRNVNKELKSCYPNIHIDHSSMMSWAYQGVMLINTCLTLNREQNGSKMVNTHMTQRLWTDFIIDTLKCIHEKNPNCIFVGWGKIAQAFISGAKVNSKCILAAGHPSPSNVHGGFLGCEHFLKINEHLSILGDTEIDWSLTDRS